MAMNQALRKTIIFTALCITFAIINACEDDNEKPSPPTVESKVIEGMLYYYETDIRVRVIDLSFNSPMRRAYTLSSDPEFPVTLQTIVDESAEDVVLKAYRAGEGSPSHPNGKFFKAKMKEEGFLFTSNVIPNLVAQSSSWDWWTVRQSEDRLAGFVFHHMGKVDGEDNYAIESLHFPGQYITHQGHPIQGTNVLTYYPFPDKESAPRWRLFRPQGIYLEGNPALVSL